MDRQFDYTQRILLAVEFGDAPRRFADMPATYACFRRLSISDVMRAVQATSSEFRAVLERSMGYWEKKVPADKHCFVHYAIGPEDRIMAMFDRLKGDHGLALLGVYRVEPQSSAYPASFPFGPTPDHWHLGEEYSLTKDSIFWFNFFPAQPYLFEKTFVVWSTFQLQQLRQRGENNQLVASDDKSRLITHGVDDLVQVNLNRFTSIPGFFASARDAGQHSFTNDSDYIWYGMLLSAVEAP